MSDKQSAVSTCAGMLFSLKEIPTHSTTWMNPEDRLNEISQPQKEKYCVSPFVVPRVVKISETVQWWLPGKWLPGKRNRSDRYGVSVWEDKNVLEIGCTIT